MSISHYAPYWIKWHLYRRWRGKITHRAEWDLTRRAWALGPGDIVVDCGANLGKMTRILAGSGAVVHAFEPDPHAFQVLSEAVKAFPNVVLHQQAVGTEKGVVRLYRAQNFAADPSGYSQSSSVFGTKSNVDTGSYVEVEQIDLVAFLAALPGRIAILKVDIEGAEVPLLEALLDTKVIDKIDQAFVETHEDKIPELRERTLRLRERVKREGRANINLDWD